MLTKLQKLTVENLPEGVITSNRGLDAVTVTISTPEGQVVQSCTAWPKRSRTVDFAFRMAQFVEDGPERLRGSLDLSTLGEGTYSCTITARTVSGEMLTVREFAFCAPVC